MYNIIFYEPFLKYIFTTFQSSFHAVEVSDTNCSMLSLYRSGQSSMVIRHSFYGSICKKEFIEPGNTIRGAVHQFFLTTWQDLSTKRRISTNLARVIVPLIDIQPTYWPSKTFHLQRIGNFPCRFGEDIISKADYQLIISRSLNIAHVVCPGPSIALTADSVTSL